jgi:hypothetical protein
MIAPMINIDPPRQPVHKSSDLTKELIFKIYQESALGERHFNDLQTIYRRIASLWLLAGFTALGYLISGDLAKSEYAYILAAVLFAAIAGGLLLLWCVDLLVYHRLLDSHFYESLRLEREYSWLPRIRQNMRTNPDSISLSREGNLFRAAMFYAVPISVLSECAVFSAWAFSSYWVVISDVPRNFVIILRLSAFTLSIPYSQAWVFGLIGAALYAPVARWVYRTLCTSPRNPRLAIR